MNNTVYSGLHAADYASVQGLCSETLAEIVAFFHPSLGNCKFLLCRDYEGHIRCELSVSAWMLKETFCCDQAFADQVIGLLDASDIPVLTRNTRDGSSIPIKAVWKKVWWKGRNYALCWASPEISPAEQEDFDLAFCVLLQQLADLIRSQKPHRLSLIVPFFDQVRSFQSEEILVGRHPKCALAFRGKPEHRRISREHAAFTLLHGNWYIRDLGSVNGTWLNGSKLSPGVNYPLTAKAIIKFAGSECVVVDSLSTAVPQVSCPDLEFADDEDRCHPIPWEVEPLNSGMDFSLGSYLSGGGDAMERQASYDAATHRVRVVTRCSGQPEQTAWIELPGSIRNRGQLSEYLIHNYSQLGISWRTDY